MTLDRIERIAEIRAAAARRREDRMLEREIERRDDITAHARPCAHGSDGRFCSQCRGVVVVRSPNTAHGTFTPRQERNASARAAVARRRRSGLAPAGYATVSQAAERAGVARQTIDHHAKCGSLSVTTIDGIRCIALADVERWIAARRNPSEQATDERRRATSERVRNQWSDERRRAHAAKMREAHAHRRNDDLAEARELIRQRMAQREAERSASKEPS